MQLPTSLLGAAILIVGLKVMGKIDEKVEVEKVILLISEFSLLNTGEIKEAAQSMLSFAKNFEKLYPNLRNLKTLYNEEFKSLIKPTSQWI